MRTAARAIAVVAIAGAVGASPASSAAAAGTRTPARAAVRPPGAKARAELFVSPSGRDSNPGTEGEPFATLERARAAVAQLGRASGWPRNGVVVWLRGGVHERTTPFTLGRGDSGKAGAPVVYRAYPEEVPRLVGGKVLQPSWWSLVGSGDARWSRLAAAARGNVYRVNLAAHGITGYGALSVRGGGYTPSPDAKNTTELFFDGAAATLARWPNAGERGAEIRAGMALTAGASDETHLRFRGTRPSRWGAALAAREVWLHAWAISYSDLHVLVTEVHGDSFTVSRDDGTGKGFFYAPPSGAPYYAENVLEELDTPGEWWMDRSSGDVYFWPPSALATGEAIVSTNTSRLVEVNGASHVTFDGIAFEVSRNQLVRIDGGSDVTLTRCRLLNAGSIGVAIRSGTRNGLDRCEIAGTGEHGIWLDGGDRPTLTPGANYVRASDIHGTARWSWNQTAAVAVYGVGNVVAQNHVHDLPDQAIWLHGNDHVVELNDIERTTRYSSDAGAIYAGRSWTQRGNEIRFNRVRDVHGWYGAAEHGIYLDDGFSGTRVVGNVLDDIGAVGIKSGGGRDNVVENNVIQSCGRAAFLVDDRAATWGWTGTNYPGDLLAVGYRSPRWAAAYPALAAIPPPPDPSVGPGSRWAQPEGGVFSRNLGHQNRAWIEGEALVRARFAESVDNVPDADPLWVDPADPRRGLRPGSPVHAIRGWRAIPFERIGVPGATR